MKTCKIIINDWQHVFLPRLWILSSFFVLGFNDILLSRNCTFNYLFKLLVLLNIKPDNADMLLWWICSVGKTEEQK
jgi:hypothetical protein